MNAVLQSSTAIPPNVAEQAEAECLKAVLERESSDALYLNATQVRRRYGSISDMTLWRWLNDPGLGFPQPIVINRRRFFKASGLDEFDAQQAAKSREAA